MGLHLSTTRRNFMGTTVLGMALAPLAAQAAGDGDAEYMYEITRTEAEWRSMLSADEYTILREGGTEPAHSSVLATDYSEGHFECRGCDLTLFTSRWREKVDIGWVFFRHAQPNSILMGIDGPREAYGQPALDTLTNIEGHCRRCGSHIGHILGIENMILHCTNGRALRFVPAQA